MSPTTRPISYSLHGYYGDLDPRTNRPKYCEKTFTGIFHSFACEGEAGGDFHAVAIVEDETGQIHTPLASKCKFLDITPV